MRKLLKMVKGAELIAGTSVLISSLWLFAPSDRTDISNAAVLSGLLFVLAPVFLVFLGSYRQTVHREALGMVLVLIGAVWSFAITKRAVVGDVWDLRVVRFELCLLFVACAAACLHTLWDFLNLLNLRRSSK